MTGDVVTRRPEIPYLRYPPQSLLNEPHYISLLPHRRRLRRVSTLTSRLTTAPSFVDLHHGELLVGGRVPDGATRPMEKMPHPQLEPAEAGSK